MKTLKITLFATAFGLLSFAPKTTIADPLKKEAAASPVSWKAEAVEVGDIPQGTPKTIEFSFKNTGTSDIVITNVKPSCGCTAADFTKTPIKPGGTGIVKATYNAAAKGAFAKTVTVETNVEAAKVLTFKGTVI